MAKLNPSVDFSFSVVPPRVKLAVEQQDFEEAIGNLLENAGRFANSKVAVRVTRVPPPEDAVAGSTWLAVAVDDDGPGLSEQERKEALKRGRRLDESKPGNGLGLSIVAEICTEYGGHFSLEQSGEGGLSARMVLPGLLARP